MDSHDADQAEHTQTSQEVRNLADELVPLFYAELRTLARRMRNRSGGSDTLQTTALVNETYFKLRSARGWNNDAHFLNAAALAMRHVLVSHARSRLTDKRGAGAAHVSLENASDVWNHDDDMLVNLNDALDRLANEAP